MYLSCNFVQDWRDPYEPRDDESRVSIHRSAAGARVERQASIFIAIWIRDTYISFLCWPPMTAGSTCCYSWRCRSVPRGRRSGPYSVQRSRCVSRHYAASWSCWWRICRCDTRTPSAPVYLREYINFAWLAARQSRGKIIGVQRVSANYDSMLRESFTEQNARTRMHVFNRTSIVLPFR